MPRTAAAALALSTVLVAAGCGGGKPATPTTATSTAPRTIKLSSPAFADGGMLPRQYTCDGEGSAPPLRWSGVPKGARELALIVQDPDARRGVFFHWVVLAISPATRGLPAGTKPATLRLGRATSGKVGYQPPCPPGGEPAHRYVFSLYALKDPLNLSEGTIARAAQARVAQGAIARGELVGRFAR